ncbi:DgyrCDS14751 [Dimorphilus gyrociliatus]|uniref:DgyrCDS14751 n=1 Tax=Dimorphilus gyrociliatus TaxID=2664684 RepID=A0A7I8WF11_9ANNE|nr:DgyrCDS14751 [Dimorphilus gyrociliatus]
MYMTKISFSAILLFVPLISGFYEDYVNLLSPHRYVDVSGSVHLGMYKFGNLFDDTSFKYKTDAGRQNISQIKIWFRIQSGEHFKLHMLRFLKLRNGHEKLNFTLTFLDDAEDYVLEHNFTNGWNEIEFSNVTFIKRIYIIVSESEFNDLEIGEFQILGFDKYFLSCYEWSYESKLKDSSVFLYVIDNWMLWDVSRIESGSTCQSSTGNCKLAIKDSVVYIDEMWKPLATDENIFIEIKFHDRYLIEHIIVKQPIENEIDTITIKSDENLIEMIVNKSSLFTSLQTKLTTKFLRFLFYKSNNQIFHGLNEIKAIGRRLKPNQIVCDSATSYIKSSDVVSLSNGKKMYNPISTDQCAESHYFPSTSNLIFRKLKYHLAANSFFCKQYLTIFCKNYKSENIEGVIFASNKKTLKFLDGKESCFHDQFTKCKCIDNFNGSYTGSINLSTNDLPILQVCVSKIFNDNETSQVELTFGKMTCFAKKDFLQSNNQDIVDNNLQTCSSNIQFNRKFGK